MNDYLIRVKQNPENRTVFKRGMFVGFGAADEDFIVLGEDDIHLHLISLDSGGYLGVFKAEPNLRPLRIRRESVSDAVLRLTEAAFE